MLSSIVTPLVAKRSSRTVAPQRRIHTSTLQNSSKRARKNHNLLEESDFCEPEQHLGQRGSLLAPAPTTTTSTGFTQTVLTQHRTLTTRSTSVPPTIPPQKHESRKYSQAPSSVLSAELQDQSSVRVPDYLNETYWWAYVHPNAVKFFERQWLVNAILWGNFSRLRDWALAELSDNNSAGALRGATLQIACVYGDLTPKMVEKLSVDASLTVVDVVQAQLDNLRAKLGGAAMEDKVHLLRRDASHLDGIADKSFDQVLLFFLLHEMPEDTRKKTLAEAARVVKPGGKIIIVDYHRPHTWNPHRLIMYPVLKTLEPFALDIWRNDVASWLPESAQKNVDKSVIFGGLYQKIIVTM